MGLPLVDTGGTFSWLGTEDVGNLPKLTQHRLSSSEVPAPGPAVLSFQGIPGEGRKVADNVVFLIGKFTPPTSAWLPGLRFSFSGV